MEKYLSSEILRVVFTMLCTEALEEFIGIPS